MTEAPDVSAALTVFGLLLAACAPAGLSLINAGLIRTRSVAHALWLSVMAFSAGALGFITLGSVVSGAGGGLLLHAIGHNDAGRWSEAAWGTLACAFVSVIPVGAGAERWRTAGALLSAGFLACFVLPLFLRVEHHSGILDIAGAGSIHAVGGLSALCVAWVVGARRGKYNASGMPMATPGHNASYILFGCLLALVGFGGLNVAGAALHGSSAPAVLVVLNTMASAAAAGMAAAAVTRIRFGKPDASLCANGWTCGLVASSATSGFAVPLTALLAGVGAGVLVVYAIELLELRCRVDDPAGAISVHAGGGLWGLLTAGALSPGESAIPQLLAVALLLGFVLPAAYAFHSLLNRFVPYRATLPNERQGMDLSELGSGAYPEFMIHRDDFR